MHILNKISLITVSACFLSVTSANADYIVQTVKIGDTTDNYSSEQYIVTSSQGNSANTEDNRQSPVVINNNYYSGNNPKYVYEYSPYGRYGYSTMRPIVIIGAGRRFPPSPPPQPKYKNASHVEGNVVGLNGSTTARNPNVFYSPSNKQLFGP